MAWIPLFFLNAFVMILCYITNPIVCLFCDEEGELHGVLNYWQTWDDSCPFVISGGEIIVTPKRLDWNEI